MTNSPWSHCGVIVEKGGKIYVLEGFLMSLSSPHLRNGLVEESLVSIRGDEYLTNLLRLGMLNILVRSMI